MTSYPHWTEEELREQSQRAVALFVEMRLGEPTRQYEEFLESCLTRIEELFAHSGGLCSLDAQLFERHPEILEAARFAAGPPISQDDMKTMTGVKPPRRSLTPDQAESVARVINQALDRKRFPWIVKGRKPSRQEIDTAVKWTAGIWAIEQIKTWRRTSGSQSQECRVAEVLEDAGYSRRPLPTRDLRPFELDVMPKGTFTGEMKLDGAKCDVPVRLRSGRLLAIECKVSNSEVNSIKRLVRETGGKADKWRRSFGEGVQTVAVLSGVFGVNTLSEAQDRHGVGIAWEHDLHPLSELLKDE